MNRQVFSVPKYELNEDAWNIPPDPGSPIVLCDGASESFDSRRWAEILTKGLARHEDFTDSWLKERIEEYEKAIEPAALSWSKQLAYERGSFATFLSVQLRHGECLVNAMGDTEAFLVKDGRIIEMYPYVEACEFLNHPCLLSTKRELNTELKENVDDCPFSGKLVQIEHATHLLMLTDALAHWLMKKKDDPEAVNALLCISSDTEFRGFVDRERKDGMRFDDTTMIRVNLRAPLPVAYGSMLPAVRV